MARTTPHGVAAHPSRRPHLTVIDGGADTPSAAATRFGSREEIDALLDRHLRDGRLVPASAAVTALDPDLPEQLRDLWLDSVDLLDDIHAHAYAEGTLDAYGGHLTAWRAWCRAKDIDALPFHPKAVQLFLQEYAFEHDYDGFSRDESGNYLPAVSAGAVTTRLSALNKAATFMGLTPPGSSIDLARLMRGIRRRIPARAVHRKVALTLDPLETCLASIRATSPLVDRDRVALLLRARTGATAGQLAHLTWDDIDLTDTRVTITLPRTHRHGQARAVTLRRHRNPQVCLVDALASLRSTDQASGPVLTKEDGTPMTRQGLHLSLTALSEWSAVPSLDDRSLARLVEERASRDNLRAARDAALLVTGFYTASRRSNLAALNWGDLEDEGRDGIRVLLRRSKTDPEGRGAILWVPEAPSASRRTCPATTVRAWKALLTDALGRAPHPDEPVFAAFTPTGSVSDAAGVLRRITGDTINDVIQRSADDAGLTDTVGHRDSTRHPYGAHSLRSGFVTEGFRGHKLTIPEMKLITGHKDVRVLEMYAQAANAACDNPAKRLFDSDATPPSR